MIDPRLIKDIQIAEGCRLEAYKDSLGFWTIGWGHLVIPQSAGPGFTWTQEQADAQLETDIAIAQAEAQRLREWPSLDTPARQNAVIELWFEMGGKWMMFVNTRNAIQAKNWQAAHDGLLKSLWASEVHATRANRVADYLLTGEYPEPQGV